MSNLPFLVKNISNIENEPAFVLGAFPNILLARLFCKSFLGKFFQADGARRFFANGFSDVLLIEGG